MSGSSSSGIQKVGRFKREQQHATGLQQYTFPFSLSVSLSLLPHHYSLLLVIQTTYLTSQTTTNKRQPPTNHTNHTPITHTPTPRRTETEAQRTPFSTHQQGAEE